MADFYNATDLIPRTNDSAGTIVSAGPYGLGLKGDFIGFTFNGEHSSDMGITRVSNGNRFNDTLLPNFQDRTGSVTGMDGMYYFGSQYGQKPIQIQIAFDYLTEMGVRHLKQVFGDKKPHWLIFDEAPYKKYLVKIAQPIQLTYICFMEDNQRIYKGEGAIGFVAYQPFARSVSKILDTIEVDNKNEWKATAGILTSEQYSSLQIDAFLDGQTYIYNPGDFDADFKLYVPWNSSGQIASGSLYVTRHASHVDDYSRQVNFGQITKATTDSESIGVCFNSALKIIEGYKELNDKYITTGVVYNKAIESGQLFKLPINNDTEHLDSLIFTSSGATNVELEYDYLYY